MCYPIVVPNTTPMVGPESKSGKQSISLYGDDGVRRVFVTDKDKVDNYLALRSKKQGLATGVYCSAVISTILGIIGLGTADSSMKNFFKNMNWKKYGALGFGAFALALIPSWLSARKACNKAEAEITGKK